MRVFGICWDFQVVGASITIKRWMFTTHDRGKLVSRRGMAVNEFVDEIY